MTTLPTTASSGDTVVAIIVTFRRVGQLMKTLRAVTSQTLRPTTVIVVDNDDDEALARRIREAFADVVYLASGANRGPGGGFAIGLAHAIEHHDNAWFWLLDDDSPPAANSLESGMIAIGSAPTPIGAIAMRGGHLRRGRIRHDLRDVDRLVAADFVLVDGALMARAAVEAAGLPREDFFIMMEDLEYSIRVRESGFGLFVRPVDGSQNLYQGSGAAWRGYYQARNHLRLGIERRSIPWLWGWCVRELAIHAHHLRHRRWSAMAMRLRGTFDGVANRMGRRVDPTANSGPEISIRP